MTLDELDELEDEEEERILEQYRQARMAEIKSLQAQCAPGIFKPNQKVHGLFHFYNADMHKIDKNQLKKPSIIGLPKFTIVIWQKNTINMQILAQKICFIRITVLEARCQMVFLTDPELFCIQLPYKSEKVHGIFGWG